MVLMMIYYPIFQKLLEMALWIIVLVMIVIVVVVVVGNGWSLEDNLCTGQCNYGQVCSSCKDVYAAPRWTQPVRRLISHRQFGARVVYEDCVFLTISPNKLHSSLVLRLYLGCIMMMFFVKLLMTLSSFRYIRNGKQDMYPKYMIQCSIIGLCSERCCK